MIQHLYSLPIPIPPFIYRIFFRHQTNKKRYRTWDYINIFVAKMRVSKLKNLTWATVVLGVSNMVVILIGGILVLVAFPSCGVDAVLPILMVLLASAVRIVTMVRTGIAQKATAASILSSPVESSVVDAVSRHERRVTMHLHFCLLIFSSALISCCLIFLSGSVYWIVISYC